MFLLILMKHNLLFIKFAISKVSMAISIHVKVDKTTSLKINVISKLHFLPKNLQSSWEKLIIQT